MSGKSPQLDSFVMPLGESVELKTRYYSAGPAGLRVMLDGELEYATSLSPTTTEAVTSFDPDEPGDYSVRLIVEAAPPSELKKLKTGDTEQPEEEKVADASWDITVAERDELHQSDLEEFKRKVADAALIYTLSTIAFKVYSNWRMVAEGVLSLLASQKEPAEEDPQATLDDYRESESDDDG